MPRSSPSTTVQKRWMREWSGRVSTMPRTSGVRPMPPEARRAAQRVEGRGRGGGGPAREVAGEGDGVDPEDVFHLEAEPDLAQLLGGLLEGAGVGGEKAGVDGAGRDPRNDGKAQ